MASLFHVDESPQFVCFDRSNYTTFDDQMKVMSDSKTVYVGNLSFFTTEEQIHEVFSQAGPVKRVIMGINSITKTPCGFCFVEYYSREHTDACLKYISGTVCDSRIIRCDLDAGFKPGRQFGRGQSGGQVRDERRRSHDIDRTLSAPSGSYRTVQIVPPPPPTSSFHARSESISTSESILAGLDRPLRFERSDSSKGRVFSETNNEAAPTDDAEEETNAKRAKA